MTEQQFAYWLQGFAELNPTPPDAAQWQSIREHLATVFKKVTPPVGLPKIDLSANKGLKDLLEKAAKESGAAGWPPAIYQPGYWLKHQHHDPSSPIC